MATVRSKIKGIRKKKRMSVPQIQKILLILFEKRKIQFIKIHEDIVNAHFDSILQTCAT
jgi:hypothetical protein